MFTRRFLAAQLFLLLLASAASAAPQAHMVFFKLGDASDANRKELVDLCHKHLAPIEGITYFSVGVLAEDLNRSVNDKQFDVALHVVFKDRAAYKVYETHPKHLKFIEEGAPLWSGVRVFDSDLVAAPPKGTAAESDEAVSE